jgi:hypothetical protein
MMECEFRLPAGFERRMYDAIVDHIKPDMFDDVGYVPDAADLLRILQIAFWSSLLRDEGRTVNFVLNLRPGQAPSRIMPLDAPVEFTAQELAKISMATTPDASAIHVGPGPSGLKIWGIDTLFGNAASVRIAVHRPASIAVIAGNAPVALIFGSRGELIDLELYATYFFTDSPFPSEKYEDQDREHRFLDIAREMHGHGHGGTLLVLGRPSAEPAGAWRSSLEAHYLLSRPFDGLRQTDEEQTGLFDASRQATTADEAKEVFAHQRRSDLSRSQYVSGLARTTAVDGATVVSHEGALLAFGCKIGLSNEPTIRRRRPTVGPWVNVPLADLGGTRHQSAARFVGKHPGSRAIVASQDGRVSILNHRGNHVECLEHVEWIL